MINHSLRLVRLHPPRKEGIEIRWVRGEVEHVIAAFDPKLEDGARKYLEMHQQFSLDAMIMATAFHRSLSLLDEIISQSRGSSKVVREINRLARDISDTLETSKVLALAAASDEI